MAVDAEEKPFYEDEDGNESDDSEKKKKKEKSPSKPQMDPDHRLLLKNSKPLLQSRNAAVCCFLKRLTFYSLKV